jgi:hypothetical protein
MTPLRNSVPDDRAPQQLFQWPTLHGIRKNASFSSNLVALGRKNFNFFNKYQTRNPLKVVTVSQLLPVPGPPPLEKANSLTF